ncbi:hypothetical protein GUJ93_ZPchr0003g16989 [Zizania palustris]|uniref:Iron hydrogenase large subunit C-terminal domain-containing protein n=1 Tax=Zizania palustris TaxID=103762 RepID=A0A8J5VUX7_ZIZPA|nr:hypothetical protein GUJ93_ZPchr0003g16989 [Zizania palustris]
MSAAASATNVAVIGGGISGAVCASLLAARGVAVTLFDSGRGAGGRMAQRREVMEDGTELRFDHGAPYFTVSNNEVARVVNGWEARGLVAEWKAMFACFDREAGKFTNYEKEETTKKYVGVPGMNSICKSLCLDDGVVAKFGVTIGKMDWIQDRCSWSLASLDGRDLGNFDYIVATDKNIASPRFYGLTGRPPLLDLSLLPQLSMMIQDIPVRPIFSLMLAFADPLTKVPVQGFSFDNSDYLSWAFCDSSKPGHAHIPLNSQSWVLHSTAEYASKVINIIGPRKPSADDLAKVAEELLKEFQATGLNIPHPIFMKAHRWGSAFPATTVGGEDKCIWDKSIKLAICGDFCVGATGSDVSLLPCYAMDQHTNIESRLSARVNPIKHKEIAVNTKPLEEAVKISLKDCLACSGCITSVETIMLEKQSLGDFVTRINSGKAVIVYVSPHSRPSLAAFFGLSQSQVFRKLTVLFNSMGVKAVYDTSCSRDLSLIEACIEFVAHYQKNQLSNGREAGNNLPMLSSACPEDVHDVFVFSNEDKAITESKSVDFMTLEESPLDRLLTNVDDDGHLYGVSGGSWDFREVTLGE